MWPLICCFLFTAVYASTNFPGKHFQEVFSAETCQNIQSVSVYSILSQQCSKELYKYCQGVINAELWALQMLDAIGKFPAGVLSGNTGDLGNFDQCLKVKKATEVGAIFGKYCLGSFSLVPHFPQHHHNTFISGYTNSSSVNLQLLNGICAPASCTAKEIGYFYKQFGFTINVVEESCQSDAEQEGLNESEIAAVSVLSVILCLILFCTIYDTIHYQKQKKPKHTILISFSVLSNFKKLISINRKVNQLSCLHGIRMLSLMWVMLGHRYASYPYVPIKNPVDVYEWAQQTSSMFLFGAHVVVDTFLLLSGLVISYGFMIATSKGMKFNIPLYYVHRYLRLTPALAATVLVSATIVKQFGSGPLWKTHTPYTTQPCRTYWWTTLLYIQNYVNPKELCIVQTHYLSVDMQLFLLSPLLLIPLKRKPKWTMYLTGLLILLSIVAPLLVAWFYELRPYDVGNGTIDQNYEHKIKFYYATHMRAASWLMGFVLGYVIYQTKAHGTKFTKNRYFGIANIFLWVVSLTTLIACVFSWHHLISENYDRLGNTLQIGLVRPAWSVAMGWIIFSCVHGYGGPVNWFLSLPLCQLMSKLSYSIYLVHTLVIVISAFRIRDAVRFGHFEIMYTYGGDIIYSTILGVIWMLAFEFPVITIEKILLQGSFNRSQKPSEPNVKETIS